MWSHGLSGDWGSQPVADQRPGSRPAAWSVHHAARQSWPSTCHQPAPARATAAALSSPSLSAEPSTLPAAARLVRPGGEGALSALGQPPLEVLCSPSKLRPADPSGQQAGRAGGLKVAVDVDEVLGRFLHSLNKFCAEEYGLEFDVGDYYMYEFAKVWQCSQDESNRIVHEFFKSTHFAVGVLPIPGALHSLQRLSAAGVELAVVTSRQHCIREATLAWIAQHFPGVFAEVHFGNHWALEGRSRSKSEICREIGAGVLVDDNPRYACECAQAGLQVLLFDWQQEYPWAKTPDGPTHERIRRVRDWLEVEAVLMAMHAARVEPDAHAGQSTWAVSSPQSAAQAGQPARSRRQQQAAASALSAKAGAAQALPRRKAAAQARLAGQSQQSQHVQQPAAPR